MAGLLVIQQYFGLGDCIWGQTIANDFIKEGYKVIWPVMPNLVEGLNYAYPHVTFIDYNIVKIDYENKEFKKIDGMMHLPMRYSESLMKMPYRYHMEGKYLFLNKDWHRWKEGAYPKRNSVKEYSLRDILGINYDEPYNFVATEFGSKGNHKTDIATTNGLKNVNLRVVDGFSLFDWCGIIENATTIHAVSSSTLYLFEVLTLKAKEIHLYVRKPIEQDFSFVEFLFSKPYILHK